MSGDRPRVLILGGGFGGIGAARKLKDAAVDVVLVDAHDYHTFQPLLYQVATDLLPESTVGHPLRDLFHDQPNARVHTATVTGIDVDRREVRFAGMEPLTYDYLVVALGARVEFFGVEGAAEHAFPLYTLADALRLREHVLERWEAADRDPSLVRDGALNVVVVGGGPTGVESAGAIAELYRGLFTQDYPDIPHDEVRIVLVEAGPEIFSMFKTKLRRYAVKELEKFGVEVRVGEVVQSVTATTVRLASGESIPAHTLVWGAGLRANPLAESLGAELQRGGRVPTRSDLSVEGHPEVFAVGDVAWIATGKQPPLPQLGGVALQSGEQAGENIGRLVEGKETKPFDYFDKGTMATIGRFSAVMQGPHGITMTGTKASLAWGAVHLALLSTGEDRAKAVVNWTWAGFTHERPARISVHTEETEREVTT
ncbi:MAG TPA: NAD(P)/FAD-dependent oxidoreductase [Gaiella sp.]|nr:NAD(P)/FAD-dependent oxidoreductase [Gaiella sp.]